MRKVLSLALVFALAQVGLRVGTAQAQSTPSPNEERARELYSNGALLYEEGRYEDAIAAWQEAYRLSQKPQLLFNIANAQERLGHYQEALDTLGRYRAYAPMDEREMLDRRIVNLERRLAEAGPVTSSTPPTAVRLPASTQPSTSPPATPATSKQEGGKFPIVPVAMFTVGAAGLGTGVVFGMQARAARTEADGLCVGAEGGTLCPGTAGEALDRDKRASLVADIGFGVGALALAGGVVVSLLDERGWQVAPGLGSLVVSGRF